MRASTGIDLRFVLSALKRFRSRSIAFFVIAVSLVTVGVMLAPREYSSDARLFIRVGRESVALDPTASMGEKISINDTRVNEINSALEMLRSRELCVRVVDRLGADFILEPPTADDATGTAQAASEPSPLSAAWTSVVKTLEAVGLLDPVDRHERAVRALGLAMGSSVPRNTHMISVSCTAPTPERAQELVKAIIDCFGEMHSQAHRTPQSHSFFVEQSDKLQNQIKADSETLSERKNELGLVSLQGQRLLLESERAQTLQQLTTATGQLAASKAKLESLETSLVDLPLREITDKTDVPNLALDNMRQLLYGLEIQEREAAALLSDNHPKLAVIRQQLQGVKDILADQKLSREQTTTGVSPTRQPLRVAQLMEKAEVDSWDAKVRSLQADDERIVADMQKFNQHQIEIERLERDLGLAESDYRSYATRREQARIDQVLFAQHITNLNVVQPPSLQRKPVSPKKLLTISLGVVAGIFGGVCLAVVSAWLDRSFHSAEELEASLSIPVLLSVPEFAAHQRPQSLARMEEVSDHATALRS